MVKPAKTRLKQIYDVPAHRRSRSVGANLSPELRAQYGIKSIRVKRDDSIRVMRGEYRGIEGKVTKVHPAEGRLTIEGIQREKVKGGNVPVLVHASKIVVVGLSLDDKWRQALLERKRKSG